MTAVLFWSASFGAVLAAVLAVSHSSGRLRAVALGGATISVAVVLAVNGMGFLAAAQVIVGSGVVLVVVLLSSSLPEESAQDRQAPGAGIRAFLGGCAALGIGAVVLAAAATAGSGWSPSFPSDPHPGELTRLGRALTGSHLLTFELATVMFVTAAVAAAYLVGRKE